MLADEIESWAKAGIVNIVGGCCGTSPEHIQAIAERVATVNPRKVPKIEKKLRLSGLEPFNVGADSLYVNVGERTNVTGSKAFARMILEGRFDDALAVARQQVENGAQVIDINMDEAMLDSLAAMDRFLKLIASEPDISRVPIMIDSSKWEVIEAGLKCIQGKGIVNSISMKEGEAKFIEQAKLARRYGAAVIVMAFDEKGQADTFARKTEISQARLRPAAEHRLPGRRHHLRPEHFRHRHRHPGTRQLRRRFHRIGALDQAEPAARPHFRRRFQRLVFFPRQRCRARGDPHRFPLPRHQGRHDHGHRQCRHARHLRRSRAGAARRRSRTWCSTAIPEAGEALVDFAQTVKEGKAKDTGPDLSLARAVRRETPRTRA